MPTEPEPKLEGGYGGDYATLRKYGDFGSIGHPFPVQFEPGIPIILYAGSVTETMSNTLSTLV